MNLLVQWVQTTNQELDVLTNEENPVQKHAWLWAEEELIKDLPKIKSAIKKAKTSWEAFTQLIDGYNVPFSSNSGKLVNNLLKKVSDEKKLLGDAHAAKFRKDNKHLGSVRQLALSSVHEKSMMAKLKDIPDATYEERDAAV
ncbi:hypothetical protein OPQ81_000841 [Rhizoctonia solani]|nr:hypothetical protein OPQ81_000841 [Rhizoctonia solani]